MLLGFVNAPCEQATQRPKQAMLGMASLPRHTALAGRRQIVAGWSLSGAKPLLEKVGPTVTRAAVWGFACSAAFASVRPRGRRSVRPRGSRSLLGRTRLAVLPDGTNEEGEALVEPLAMRREELADVVLYQQELSPPCAKIRAFLKYYDVPFKTIKGRHPTSAYKKIPVLEMNGRQVNDSHIILTSLAPVLSGNPLTEDERAWEKKLTFGFLPAFEVELAAEGDDLSKLFGFDAGGWQAGLVGLLAPLLGSFLGSVFKDRYPDMKLPSSSYGVDFRKALAGRPFYHGEKPGPVDLSLYGTYAAFSEKRCSTAARFLQDSDLQDWHNRMVKLVPSILEA